MNVILDASALIGVERGATRIEDVLELYRRRGEYLRTPAPALAQVWRDGPRQERLSRFLNHVAVLPVDESHAKAAGTLCGRSGTSDAVDAFVALAAEAGDTIVTSDPHDMKALTSARGEPVRIVCV